jgi:hypothetical protein
VTFFHKKYRYSLCDHVKKKRWICIDITIANVFYILYYKKVKYKFVVIIYILWRETLYRSAKKWSKTFLCYPLINSFLLKFFCVVTYICNNLWGCVIFCLFLFLHKRTRFQDFSNFSSLLFFFFFFFSFFFRGNFLSVSFYVCVFLWQHSLK